MKSLLTVAGLLVALAAPALADDAATPPPPPTPQAQAALTASPDQSAPQALPKSQPAAVVPMSATLDANAPPPARSGCGHDKSTVYLTN